ncbi:MAG TPA: carboxypeptidase-like regulatory domain-containing protein [Candidatus Methylomirabilis sp.]|nr:carboxypeptidase-like regulatory domain-containing protein [Candidatus Methylomirabilis sp.]
MSEWVVVRHMVAVAGRVLDAQSGKPVGGARVKITAGPSAFTTWLATSARQHETRWAVMEERPDQTRSRGDGHFHFMDLPDGAYTLTATVPESGSRFGEAGGTATVSRNAEGHISPGRVEIHLPPTTVKGLITGQDDAPVVMAEVRMTASGERVFTDGQGRYLLTRLEAGARRVEVTARGYQQASRTAGLNEAGAVLILDVSLVPVTP